MTQIPSTGPAGQPGSQDPVGSAGGVLRSLPKISLHDHLDGGLRPQTLLELAEAAGTEPPARTTTLSETVIGVLSSGAGRWVTTTSPRTAELVPLLIV